MFTLDRKLRPSAAHSPAPKPASQRPVQAPPANPLWTRLAMPSNAGAAASPEMARERQRDIEPIVSPSSASGSRIGHTDSGAGVEAEASPPVALRPRFNFTRIPALSPSVQRKATVSSPGDSYERQADEVADKVMRMAEPAPMGLSPGAIQPESSAHGAEEKKTIHTGGALSTGGEGTLAGPRPAAPEGSIAAPPIVGEVLSSGDGQPLNAETRAYFEPRFGADLGGVRLHTDARATSSARAVNAQAYTVGRDIVLGDGAPSLDTGGGRRLLAHELAHVSQQSSLGARAIVQRSPLPGYAQKGDTCEPASLLTALIIWDRERADPAAPNSNVVAVCNTALIHLAQNQAGTIQKWGGGAGGQKQYAAAVASLTTIRDSAHTSTTSATEGQFQEIAQILSELGDINYLEIILGLKPSSTDSQNTLAGIFGSSNLTSLTPGQIAQIEWYVRTSSVNVDTGAVTPSLGYHAFLIGRQASGTWFLSDQANNPPLNLEAPDLPALQKELEKASSAGRSSIETNPATTRLQMTWTGVRVIGSPAGMEGKHKALVPSGTFLAEVDAGPLVDGDRIRARDFVGIAYSLSEARALFSSFGGIGALIGEMPKGVFNIYGTDPVSEKNFTDGIDIADSTGGLLVKSPPVFEHAWLQLVDAPAKVWKSTLVAVY
jgi:Domain of unknown function (DUF4157)